MNQQQNNEMQQYFYRASAVNFNKIPGSPIAYWASAELFKSFKSGKRLGNMLDTAQGMKTLDNERFIRGWSEVSEKKITDDTCTQKLWVPINHGGGFRKWYGFNDSVINWKFDGADIKSLALKKYNSVTRTVTGMGHYFESGITWSAISSEQIGVRKFGRGFIFTNAGMCAFGEHGNQLIAMALLNSKIGLEILKILAPSVNFGPNQISEIPVFDLGLNKPAAIAFIQRMIDVATSDWDAYEISMGFTYLPLINASYNQPTLMDNYRKLHAHWLETTIELQRLEEENNRLFIDTYGLQDELTPEVPLNEITLTCNPHYRYGGNLTDEEREARLQSDTLAELISYAIGCMMGRYSLDREGLVYAHAGNEGFKALVEEGAYSTFAADEDGILPLTSDNWFPDDVAARFEAFIRTVWGAETLEENLQFIADSLCLSAIKPVKKGGETARETIRRYLSTQFFKDHMKTYKKRPIYWLFSSGKEKAFECLVYLHRYNEATLPRMRTEYVTPLLGQMAGRIERLRLQQAEAGTAEAKRIGKEIDTLSKQLTELRAFDDELKHHADMRITLDLDDGVKVNYGKFGNLLSEVKAITGDKGE
ncbi:BREX-1 system adenine-specific DNA-methyltransferase PglX [Aeromonas caviae]